MGITPQKLVPLHQPGCWKSITDDGVTRGCGVLSPEWINSFGHKEGNAQSAIISHFPQKYAMTTSGMSPDFGTGLAQIGGSLTKLINDLKALNPPPPPPKTKSMQMLSEEFFEVVRSPLRSPTLLPDYTVDPAEIESFERACLAHLIWANAEAIRVKDEIHMEVDPISVILAVTAVIGAVGTVWSIVQNLIGSEKDMLKVPWGDYSNADGSLTHVYAQWYQGSAVRLRWVWGGTERDVYIQKMSSQIMTVLDDVRTIRQKQPKLPHIGLKIGSYEAVSLEVPAPQELPSGYTGERKLSRSVSREQELIAKARGLTLEQHFNEPQVVVKDACPAHVQNALSYARDQIQYNIGVRQRISDQLTFGSYARQRAESAIAWGATLLNIWAGTSPIPVKQALSIISTMVAIELDLVRHIPLWELAQEYGNATRQIEEAAGLLRHIEASFPACSSD